MNASSSDVFVHRLIEALWQACAMQHEDEQGSGNSAMNQIMPFRVMTWNVLAHVLTHWDHRFHGGIEKSLETETQRRTRHRAVVNAVMRELPDVVLLQEVDEFFMPPDWQCGLLPCGLSLPGYEAFKSYA